MCLALPARFPVLNEQAVGLATRAALAISCEVQPVSVFARKNYFYPDCPKGYQISQFDRPLALRREIEIGGARRRAVASASSACTWRRTRASRSTIAFAGVTAVDLNRAGVRSSRS